MEATDWLATAKRLPTSQSDDRPEGPRRLGYGRGIYKD
jgi:hypothetical protein